MPTPRLVTSRIYQVREFTSIVEDTNLGYPDFPSYDFFENCISGHRLCLLGLVVTGGMDTGLSGDSNLTSGMYIGLSGDSNVTGGMDIGRSGDSNVTDGMDIGFSSHVNLLNDYECHSCWHASLG